MVPGLSHGTKGGVALAFLCSHRKLVRSFTRWIRRGWLIADAGYVSKELCEQLRQRGIIMITPLRKNMKVLATKMDLALMKLRRRIESLFSVLKERMGLLRSTHLAAIAGFVHIFSCVLAYCFRWLLAHQAQLPTQVNALLFP